MIGISHFVTCLYCQEKFDRDREPAIQVSPRRYAHQRCFENVKLHSPELVPFQSQEDVEKQDLEEYLQNLFNEFPLNIKAQKQIMQYRKEYKYTYRGMLNTLRWWYDITGHSIDQANGGVGIIPYIYEDAKAYYQNLTRAQLSNMNKKLEDYVTTAEEVTIQSPRAKVKQLKLFNVEVE